MCGRESVGGECGIRPVARCIGTTRACVRGWERTARSASFLLVHLARRGSVDVAYPSPRPVPGRDLLDRRHEQMLLRVARADVEGAKLLRDLDAKLQRGATRESGRGEGTAEGHSSSARACAARLRSLTPADMRYFQFILSRMPSVCLLRISSLNFSAESACVAQEGAPGRIHAAAWPSAS